MICGFNLQKLYAYKQHTFPASVLVFINNGESLVSCGADQIQLERLSLIPNTEINCDDAVKYPNFSIYSANEWIDTLLNITAVFKDNMIYILDHNVQKFVVQSIKTPILFKLSHNSKYLAYYTDKLYILNTKTFELLTLDCQLYNFIWDDHYSCFGVNNTLYAIFSSICPLMSLKCTALSIPTYQMNELLFSIPYFQFDTSCLDIDILDKYKLHTLTKNALKTAMCLLILMDHQNYKICQLLLDMKGNSNELLMQLNIEPQEYINRSLEPVNESNIVDFYKNCPSNLIYSILDRDYIALAPLINRKEVYSLISQELKLLHKFEEALKFTKLANENSYELEMILGISGPKKESLDYYYAASSAKGLEKINFYLKANCHYHAFLELHNHLNDMPSSSILAFASKLDLNREELKQVGLLLEKIDPQASNLFYEKMLKVNSTSRKQSQKQLDTYQVHCMDMLHNKNYKEAMKLIIKKDIKITLEMHELLLMSDLNMGELYLRLGYIDYANAWFFKYKDIEGLIKVLEIQIKEKCDANDYAKVLDLISKLIKVYQKANKPTEKLEKEIEYIQLYLKSLELDSIKKKKIMSALGFKSTYLQKHHLQ